MKLRLNTACEASVCAILLTGHMIRAPMCNHGSDVEAGTCGTPMPVIKRME